MELDITADLCDELDLVFSALPHKASAEACIPLLEQGVKVVDISADFRLKQADVYSRWYGVEHPDPTYLEEAVYGLTELNREAVADARLVANPGCYPSSAILALAPAIKHGLIGSDIIVDSKSGVSGAGRSLSMTTHFSEVNENVMAYSVNGHRHLPEISQELDNYGDSPVNLTFLTHLIPMTRGILSSCYAPLSGDIARDPDANERIRRALPGLLRRRRLRAGRQRAAADQANPGQQPVPALPGGGPARQPAHRHQLLGQPGEGRGRPGGAEHEPDVRFPGGNVAGSPGRVPVIP